MLRQVVEIDDRPQIRFLRRCAPNQAPASGFPSQGEPATELLPLDADGCRTATTDMYLRLAGDAARALKKRGQSAKGRSTLGSESVKYFPVLTRTPRSGVRHFAHSFVASVHRFSTVCWITRAIGSATQSAATTNATLRKHGRSSRR